MTSFKFRVSSFNYTNPNLGTSIRFAWITKSFGLTAQIQRAAVSIVSNIAEGQGRLTKGEFRQFLGQARGSLLEVLTQLEMATALTYVTETEMAEAEIKGRELLRIITALCDSMRP